MATKKDKGLGDIVEDITKATGIKAAVKFIAGQDCGCDERKEKLNNLKIFKKKPMKVSCMTEREYLAFPELKRKLTEDRQLGHKDSNTFITMYRRIFNSKDANICGTCKGAGKKAKLWLDQLNAVYETYGDKE